MSQLTLMSVQNLFHFISLAVTSCKLVAIFYTISKNRPTLSSLIISTFHDFWLRYTTENLQQGIYNSLTLYGLRTLNLRGSYIPNLVKIGPKLSSQSWP